MSSMSGPLFDGRADTALAQGLIDIRDAVAKEGVSLASSVLSASIKHSVTGEAVRSVTSTGSTRTYQSGKYSMVVTTTGDDTVVTTSLASYGPWLEGTGSRNATTRFKGYHSFRMAGQELESRAQSIAEAAIAPSVGEMQ